MSRESLDQFATRVYGLKPYVDGEPFTASYVSTWLHTDMERTIEKLSRMYQDKMIDRIDTHGRFYYVRRPPENWLTKAWRTKSNAELNIKERGWW